MVLEIQSQNAVKVGNSQTMTIHLGPFRESHMTSRANTLEVLLIFGPL